MNTRLSVNINDETAVYLRRIADKRQASVTEIIRRAVSVYKYLEDATAEGGRIQLTKGRRTWDVSFLP